MCRKPTPEPIRPVGLPSGPDIFALSGSLAATKSRTISSADTNRDTSREAYLAA